MEKPPRKPEIKLMRAIFGRDFRDEDLLDVVDGITLMQALCLALETLPAPWAPQYSQRVIRVMRLRFGFEDGRSRTLTEVGLEFNVTRERIRQIEGKALRKLRHHSRSRKLESYIKQT